MDGHLCDVHPILVYLYLVAELITTFILTIEQHINSRTIGRIGHPQATTQFEGQQITHQRLVTVVIDERPFLGLGRCIEHVLLLIKLDAIGLLIEIT